jgi:elongation factor P hydroxylase
MLDVDNRRFGGYLLLMTFWKHYQMKREVWDWSYCYCGDEEGSLDTDDIATVEMKREVWDWWYCYCGDEEGSLDTDDIATVEMKRKVWDWW